MSEARAYETTVTRVKTVTMIPPRLQAMPGMPTFAVRPKRVAAYARVSTNSEEQLNSYENQKAYYRYAADFPRTAAQTGAVRSDQNEKQ